MKKLLIILGSVFGILIVAGIIVFSIIAIKGTALDKESKAYVDEVTPKILANLNKEALFLYASDELKNSASQEDFEKIFNWFGKLGKFVEYKESKGQARISVTTQNGKQITAYYEAQTEFETGPATIKVTAIKKADDWQIIGFNINSMALASQ
jgi:hypothetical protein